MTAIGNNAASPGASRRDSLWGRVLVALSACVLTVSIVGSIAWLSSKAYERRSYQEKVRQFVGGLENRSAEELDHWAAQLRSRKTLARYVLPQLLDVLRGDGPERQRLAAIRVARAFLDKNRIRSALLEMARDGRHTETLAGAAVTTLAEGSPVERAVDLLGQCLEVSEGSFSQAAVLDEACAGLVRHGEAGMTEYRKRASRLSSDRRVWLAGFVRHHGGEHRGAWLDLLGQDQDPRVRAAAAAEPADGAPPENDDAPG